MNLICPAVDKLVRQETSGDEQSVSEEECYDVSHMWPLDRQEDQVHVMSACLVNKQHKENNAGASCNVLPISDYVRATGDKKGALLKNTTT